MANFDVAARTLIHLGAELITSDEIALYELIKNAFDAGSQRVSIEFEIPIAHSVIKKCEQISRKHSDDLNLCIIRITKKLEENNFSEWGSKTYKRLETKIRKLSNAKDAQGVSEILESINYIKVTDTGCGMDEDLLKGAFLRIGTNYKLDNDSSNSNGRTLLGNKGIGRLSMMRLGDKSDITTWVEEDPKAKKVSFSWKDFEDPKKSISEISFPLKDTDKPDTSLSGTKILITALKSNWDEESVRSGLVDKFLRRLRNPFELNITRFPIDITFNRKKRIPISPLDKDLKELADRHLIFDFHPSKDAKKEDEILKTTIISLKGSQDELIEARSYHDVCKKLDTTNSELENIGKLKLKIRWYNRRNLAQMGLGKDLTKIRKKLDNWAGGIAVYRDGFRVGLTGSDKDGDWLGLDEKALKGGGYIVNRIQTVGVLEISKLNNPRLLDRSNREGLIHTPELNLLKKLLLEFPVQSLKTLIATDAEEEKKKSMAKVVDEGTGLIESSLKKATQNINAIRNKVPSEHKKYINNLNTNLHHISTEVKKFDSAVSKLSKQSENILELAGVGTIMHSVLHELARTTTQTRQLLLKISKETDGVTQDLLNKLEVEIKSINTRLRQLDPLSPDGRQRKSKFDIVKLTKTILEGYSSRFERHKIKVIFTVDDIKTDNPVIVKMVKGFYSLAIENLLTNSVFWLQDHLMPGESERIIRIDIDSIAKVLTIFDNGPGISPNDQNRIFSPGFSLKPKGNGYGLYIAREVALHHDATLVLDLAKESDGRFHTFVLELPRD